MKEESAEKRLFDAIENLTNGAVLHLKDFENKGKEVCTALEKVVRKLGRITESRDDWKYKHDKLKEAFNMALLENNRLRGLQEKKHGENYNTAKRTIRKLRSNLT